MSKSRLLVQFGTFRVQNKVFDEISRWFCMVLSGEAEKHVFRPKALIGADKNFLEMFWYCWVQARFSHKTYYFQFKKPALRFLDEKPCIIMLLKWRNHFGIRNVRIHMKSRDLDMSGPAKASPRGQVLVNKAVVTLFLFFFRYYTFPFVITTFIIQYWDLAFWRKSNVLLNKCMVFDENHMFY